jgi:PKD repeat protein
MARTTKTIIESEQVDVDADGDIDATVTTTTTLVMEGDQVVESTSETTIVEVPEGQNDEPGGGEPPVVIIIEPRVPGACGGTPCAGSARKKVTFTNTNVAKVFTFTPTNFGGDIAWDFGDGTPVVVGRGPVSHTYATAGAKTVVATPLASSVRMTDSKSVTVP